MAEDSKDRWANAPMPKATIGASLVIGTMGVMIAGVQPVLFGALLTAGHITAAQIGYTAAAELISIGIGVALADFALERKPVWLTAGAALLLLVLLNIATTYTRGFDLLLVRTLAGLPSGVLLWMTTAVIVRSKSPTALSAAFLLTQAVLQFAVSAGLAFGSSQNPGGVPWTLAALSAASLLLIPQLPKAFTPLPKDPSTVSGLPPFRGWIVLLVSLLIQGCIVGAWVYMEPLGKQAGMSPNMVKYAVPASLGAQVCGGTLAILLAKRVAWLGALITSSGLLTVVLVILSLPPAPEIFFVLVAGFGALWIFITPYLTPLSIQHDPTRRTAQLVPAAVVIGSGAGPLVAAAFATESDASQVLRLCAVFATASVALILLLNIIKPSDKSKSIET